MNCEQLIKSWNVPHHAGKSCQCWIIKSPLDVLLLHPNTVNELIIPFTGKTPSIILEVKTHMENVPWRIITKYLYFNDRTSSITIPIMTTKKIILTKEDAICHVQLMEPISKLEAIKSKIFYIYLNSKIKKSFFSYK